MTNSKKRYSDLINRIEELGLIIYFEKDFVYKKIGLSCFFQMKTLYFALKKSIKYI